MKNGNPTIGLVYNNLEKGELSAEINKNLKRDSKPHKNSEVGAPKK